MKPEVLTAIQAIVVALLVFGGQYVVAKLSKKAQSETVEVDAQAKATEAWQKYAEEMKTRLDGLERRLADCDERERENTKRINALEREREHDRDLIRRLVQRLRISMQTVRALGGDINDADLEVADLAQHRLDFSDPNI